MTMDAFWLGLACTIGVLVGIVGPDRRQFFLLAGKHAKYQYLFLSCSGGVTFVASSVI